MRPSDVIADRLERIRCEAVGLALFLSREYEWDSCAKSLIADWSRRYRLSIAWFNLAVDAQQISKSSDGWGEAAVEDFRP